MDELPRPPKRPDPAGRDERLAARLRENLKRRKEQARGRVAADEPAEPDSGSPSS